MFVALTLADLEEVAQVERLRDTLDSSLSPADEKGRYYNKIPGFSMTAGATPYPEEVSREGCQSKCSPDPECKSYSWRGGADKACLTSTEALSYDSAYNLYVQSKTKKTRTYREFPGLVYRATGWVEKVGIAATECQKVCDSMDACAAFSYTIPNDDVSLAKCLLSGKAISYSPGFNYYEKKGVKIATSTADGEATVPTAEEKQKVSPVKKALMKDLRGKIKEAKGEIKASLKAELAMMKEKKQMEKALRKKTKEVERAETKKQKSEKKGIEEEVDKKATAFALDESKKMAVKKEQEILQLAAAEMKNKETLDDTKATREQAIATSAAETAKTDAETAKKSAEMKGEQEAKDTAEKQKISDEEGKLQKDKETIAAENAKSAVEVAAAAANKKAADVKLAMKTEQDKILVSATEKLAVVKEAEAQKDTEAKVAEARAAAAKEQTAERQEQGEEVKKQNALAQVKTSEQNKVNAKTDAEREKNKNNLMIAEEVRVQKAGEEVQKALGKEAEAEAKKKEEQAMALIAKDEQDVKNAQALSVMENLNKEKMAEAKKISDQQLEKMKFEEAKKEEVRAQASRNVAKAADLEARDAAKIEAKKAEVEAATKEAEVKQAEEDAAKQIASEAEKAKLEAKQAVEKLASDEKLAQESIETQKADDIEKAKAKRVEEVAKQKAVEAKAVADAKLEKSNAEQEAKDKTAKAAKQADMASRIAIQTVYATVAAYTDSGIKLVGSNIAQMEAEVKKAKEAVVVARVQSRNANKTYIDAVKLHKTAVILAKKATGEDEASDEAVANAAKSNVAEAKIEAEAKADKLKKKGEEVKAAAAERAADRVADEAKKKAEQKAERVKAAAAAAPRQRPRAPAPRQRPRAAAAPAAAAPAAPNALSLLETRESARYHRLIRARRHLLHDLEDSLQVASPQRRLLQEDAKSSNITKAPTPLRTLTPTVTPTRAPTPSPTVDDAIAKAAREARMQVNLAALAENKAKAEKDLRTKKFLEEEAAYQLSTKETQVAIANTMPANTPQGKLPEMTKQKGFLQLQNAEDHIREVFLKFDMSTLEAGDVIKGGVLRMYKKSGGEADAIVRISVCAWERGTITFTNSQKFGEKQCQKSPSKFPALLNTWAEIVLDGPALEKKKNADTHLCLKIEGGPSGEPDVFDSENTANKPELKLEIIKATTAEEKAAKIAAEKKKQDLIKEKARFKITTLKELTAEFKKEKLAGKKETEDKAEAGFDTQCQADLELKTQGSGLAALQASELAKTASATKTEVQNKRKELTATSEAENKNKVANSNTAVGSVERTKLETELKEATAKTIEQQMATFTQQAEKNAQEEASKAAETAVAALTKEMTQKCEKAKEERTKGYQQLTTDDGASIKTQAEAALPAALEKFVPSREMQVVRLKESAYTSHLQHSQVQLLDDGAVSW